MGNTINTLKSVTSVKAARQTPQQKPAKPKSKPTPSTSRFLLHFAQRHPFICLFVTWGAMLYFGWLAISGLTYTNPAPLETPQPEPVAEAPQPFKIDRPATSFGLLAVVAGSCAVTSALLARQLRPVKSAPRNAAKRVVIEPKQELRYSQGQSRSPVSSRRPLNPPATKPIPKAQAGIAKKPVAKPPARPPVVTVLSEEDSPFEMRDPSLAEMMDIRQRRA